MQLEAYFSWIRGPFCHHKCWVSIDCWIHFIFSPLASCFAEFLDIFILLFVHTKIICSRLSDRTAKNWVRHSLKPVRSDSLKQIWLKIIWSEWSITDWIWTTDNDHLWFHVIHHNHCMIFLTPLHIWQMHIKISRQFKCRIWTIVYALYGCLKQGTGVCNWPHRFG